MSTAELTKLNTILVPTSRPENVDATKEYNLLGIRLDGGGAFLRETKLGSQTSAATLFQVKAGDFIYSRLFAWRGAFDVISSSLSSYYVSSEFPTFLPRDDKVDLKFLLYWFRLPSTLERVEADCTGSTPLTRNRFKEKFFLELEIPLPPLEEQRRIVARIEGLAVKIEEARGLRREVEEETQALITAFFMRYFKNTPINGILNDVLSEKPRNGWSAVCDNLETGTPVLTLSAVTGFVYRDKAYKRTSEPTLEGAHYWLHTGDLLITRSNTPDLVGHAAIYNGSPSPCIYPDLMMKLSINEDCANKHFVHLWLRSPFVRNYISSMAKGTSPTMRKIVQDSVMNIPFPSHLAVREQENIIKDFDTLESSINAAKKLQAESSAELNALLPSLLDKAFKGEL
jgi:type I restriction enzyme, S subunit